ncbi:MAG TPA: class I SAM-dependent methyltransferase [Candidatus Limnocylindrales bacterium]
MNRLVVPFGLATLVLVVRRDLIVRVVRWLDRRGGITSRRGEDAYAAASGLFAGIHHRVVADAATRGALSIVDIGAGPGDVLEELRRRDRGASLTGVEPSERMRSIAAARGIAEVDGRAEHLPLADDSVDLVLSTLSSHHWDDSAAAFAEIARVLRPGGEARIYDVRFAGFGPDEVRRIARDAGLEPASVRHEVLDERLFGLRPYSLITITS